MPQPTSAGSSRGLTRIDVFLPASEPSISLGAAGEAQA